MDSIIKTYKGVRIEVAEGINQPFSFFIPEGQGVPWAWFKSWNDLVAYIDRHLASANNQ